MMVEREKDIVERLRAIEGGDFGDWCHLISQAAAELERLRSELQWIADTPMKWTKSQNDIYWSNVATAMASKAMAALGAGAKD